MNASAARHPRLLLAEALGATPSAVSDDASMENIPQWDSFGHLHFMLALEKHFGIAITDASIKACRTLAGACAYLSEQGKSWESV